MATLVGTISRLDKITVVDLTGTENGLPTRSFPRRSSFEITVDTSRNGAGPPLWVIFNTSLSLAAIGPARLGSVGEVGNRTTREGTHNQFPMLGC